MSSNYPPGTGPNDPNAPWNRPDSEDVQCEECGEVGTIEDDKCSVCEEAKLELRNWKLKQGPKE